MITADDDDALRTPSRIVPVSPVPATAAPSLHAFVATGVTSFGTSTATVAESITGSLPVAEMVAVLVIDEPSSTWLSGGSSTGSTRLSAEPSGRPTEPGGFGACSGIVNVTRKVWAPGGPITATWYVSVEGGTTATTRSGGIGSSRTASMQENWSPEQDATNVKLNVSPATPARW